MAMGFSIYKDAIEHFIDRFIYTPKAEIYSHEVEGEVWARYLLDQNYCKLPQHKLSQYTIDFLEISCGPKPIRKAQPIEVNGNWQWGTLDDESAAIATYISPGGYQITSFLHLRNRFCFKVSGHVPKIPPRLQVDLSDEQDWDYMRSVNWEIEPIFGFLSRTWGPRREQTGWQYIWFWKRQREIQALEQLTLDTAYGPGIRNVDKRILYPLVTAERVFCDWDPNEEAFWMQQKAAVEKEKRRLWQAYEEGGGMEEEIPLLGEDLYDEPLPLGCADSGYSSEGEDQELGTKIEEASLTDEFGGLIAEVLKLRDQPSLDNRLTEFEAKQLALERDRQNKAELDRLFEETCWSDDEDD
ncbi:hypothetical protein FN846DRAFT_909838 [Sphaerosporella brunnea]|uniref:Uncharacterized protein n=1 Tax=Sphaerosporella brunnea TaxID=1250544 RepID=A0A5J5EPG0_9PEZI|nr:hypothetical protein FN846DRAFT_909838 [Sphaerosporella brunnea]